MSDSSEELGDESHRKFVAQEPPIDFQSPQDDRDGGDTTALKKLNDLVQMAAVLVPFVSWDLGYMTFKGALLALLTIALILFMRVFHD